MVYSMLADGVWLLDDIYAQVTAPHHCTDRLIDWSALLVLTSERAAAVAADAVLRRHAAARSAVVHGNVVLDLLHGCVRAVSYLARIASRRMNREC